MEGEQVVGLMTASKHKKGYPMMLLDLGATTEPMTLEDGHFEQYLNSICIKYGLKPYLVDSGTKKKNDTGSNSSANERYDDDTPLESEIIEMIRTRNLDAKIEILDGT